MFFTVKHNLSRHEARAHGRPFKVLDVKLNHLLYVTWTIVYLTGAMIAFILINVVKIQMYNVI